MREEWLQSLKVEDEVLLVGRSQPRLATVVKATRVTIEIDRDGLSFKRKDGSQRYVARHDCARYIYPVTEDVRKELLLYRQKFEVLTSLYGNYLSNRMTFEEMQHLYDLVEKVRERNTLRPTRLDSEIYLENPYEEL